MKKFSEKELLYLLRFNDVEKVKKLSNYSIDYLNELNNEIEIEVVRKLIELNYSNKNIMNILNLKNDNEFLNEVREMIK